VFDDTSARASALAAAGAHLWEHAKGASGRWVSIQLARAATVRDRGNLGALSEAHSFDPIEEAGRQSRGHWGPSHVAEMMAVTSIMRVQQILLSRLNETLERFGLTFARYEALMLLYFSRAGALPLGKIGARLQVHPTSVTNLIDGLERAGDVSRSPHPTDSPGHARENFRIRSAHGGRGHRSAARDSLWYRSAPKDGAAGVD
jgi:DNA-binding MarR family transcriptional regulator